MWGHTIAILAGGESSRMGEPKHLVKLPDGNTMLQSMIQFASTLTGSIVIVGANVKGYTCIQDMHPKLGPVGGIEALLYSNHDYRYLVLGCDMPKINIHSITPLIKAKLSAMYVYQERLLGLPLIIDESAKFDCTEYLQSGRRSIRDFMLRIPHELFEVNRTTLDSISSINSHADLDNLALEHGRL